MQNPYLLRAIELALRNVNDRGGGPFGSVIVKSGEILAEGVNQVTTHHDPTAHAEVVAIRNACRKLETFELQGCDIYASCEPCPMCLAAIYWARIDRIYYAASRQDAALAGFDDEFLYREIALPPAERRIPIEQQHRDEALFVFENWGKDYGKIPY
ncbi:nucleoside deaminase [Bryobacter aggregatus]|uniref:nucleoside deaminase n=1 Tax=Bryobacter aggregatus TaxID=360054 RepID=UPI0004E213B3|nr:nucleoside deaminase [Bryobacter aggregatus]